jgi:ABC-type nickel/cobalt efflux system permease component RcnA
MTHTSLRRGIAVMAAATTMLLLLHLEAAFAAKSPFGIATPDSSGCAFGGPLGGFFAWVAFYQAQFYRALTRAFADMKQNGEGAYALASVSFLYGVFHAVGPGHGKAVIMSYLLASGQTVKRSIVISFAAALMQGLTAIAIVLVAVGLLHATAVGMTRATDWFEVISYALIAGMGAWLLWVKITGRGHHHHHHGHDHDHEHQHAHDLGAAYAGAHDHAHAHAEHSHAAEHQHVRQHDHGACGHSHMPDPRMLSQPLTLSRAWAAILAVGIRPCSGAIIMLVFALSQNWLLLGIGSVLVMAFGTFLTVSVLAVLAVAARDLSLRLVGLESGFAERIIRVVEIGGALLVFLLGVTLLGGALTGGLGCAA